MPTSPKEGWAWKGPAEPNMPTLLRDVGMAHMQGRRNGSSLARRRQDPLHRQTAGRAFAAAERSAEIFDDPTGFGQTESLSPARLATGIEGIEQPLSSVRR